MAMEETYLSAEAVAEIRAHLTQQSEIPLNRVHYRKAVVLGMGEICFIFGVENKDDRGINQATFQDAIDWFTAKIGVWPELGSVTASWVSGDIKLWPA